MTDWGDIESGPFCEHWADPVDCEEMCKCGHLCSEHDYDRDCNNCECAEFVSRDALILSADEDRNYIPTNPPKRGG